MRHIGAMDLETRWAELLTAGARLAQDARGRAGLNGKAAVAGALTTVEWCFRPDLAPDLHQAYAEYLEVGRVFAAARRGPLLIETGYSVGGGVAAGRAPPAVSLPH